MPTKRPKNENPTRPSPSEQRKIFAAFARQLEQGVLPTEEQLEWLQRTFDALSDPDRDVMRVLGLNYTAGRSPAKEVAAQKMDVLMHWVAGAISQDTSAYKNPEDCPPPLPLEEAFEEAAKIAKLLFCNDATSTMYDSGYIRKCWYETESRHRQSPDRNPLDPRTYYSFPVDI
jgi:hypothetical protein